MTFWNETDIVPVFRVINFKNKYSPLQIRIFHTAELQAEKPSTRSEYPVRLR